MSKGELRQAYTMFYVNEAKQIIEEFYAKKNAVNSAEGREQYKNQQRILLRNKPC